MIFLVQFTGGQAAEVLEVTLIMVVTVVQVVVEVEVQHILITILEKPADCHLLYPVQELKDIHTQVTRHQMHFVMGEMPHNLVVVVVEEVLMHTE
jgi:hypothetical protein